LRFLCCGRQIHWFSIFNSFMMVIFLVGLVTLILIRTLNRDLARYEHRNHHNELVRTRPACPARAPRPYRSRPEGLPGAVPLRTQERELADDYGWKLVHGDVFRAPPQLGLFAALVGTGWQLTVLTVVVLLITIATDLYTEYACLRWPALLRPWQRSHTEPWHMRRCRAGAPRFSPPRSFATRSLRWWLATLAAASMPSTMVRGDAAARRAGLHITHG